MRHYAQAYWASLVALVCYVTWLTLVLILHVVTDDFYDPAAQRISQLALGRYGELLNVALVIMGIGVIALAVALIRSVGGIFVSPVMFTIAGLLWMLAGAFETGPAGAFGAGGGGRGAVIHDVSALTSFILIIVAIFMASWSFRHDPTWSSFARPTFIWAFGLLVTFVGMALVGEELEGLAQRLNVAAWLSWFVVVALRVRSLSVN